MAVGKSLEKYSIKTGEGQNGGQVFARPHFPTILVFITFLNGGQNGGQVFGFVLPG
jgi:hypothetical protein